MKKILAVLLVTAISVSSIGLTSSPAAADDHDGWSSERRWRDEYDRDPGDGYYRDRGRNYYRDQDYRRGHSGKRHRDTAIIAGIAGLALGAVIVGSLANQRQETRVYSRPANRDRLIYDPNY